MGFGFVRNLAALLGLGDVLAVSNTTDGTDIAITAEDKITFDSSGVDKVVQSDVNSGFRLELDTLGGGQVTISNDGVGATSDLSDSWLYLGDNSTYLGQGIVGGNGNSFVVGSSGGGGYAEAYVEGASFFYSGNVAYTSPNDLKPTSHLSSQNTNLNGDLYNNSAALGGTGLTVDKSNTAFAQELRFKSSLGTSVISDVSSTAKIYFNYDGLNDVALTIDASGSAPYVYAADNTDGAGMGTGRDIGDFQWYMDAVGSKAATLFLATGGGDLIYLRATPTGTSFGAGLPINLDTETKIVFDSSGTNKDVITDSNSNYRLSFNKGDDFIELATTDLSGTNYGGYTLLSESSSSELGKATLAYYNTSAAFDEVGIFDNGVKEYFAVVLSGTKYLEIDSTEINIGGGLPINIDTESKIVFDSSGTNKTVVETSAGAELLMDGDFITLSSDGYGYLKGWLDLDNAGAYLAFGTNNSDMNCINNEANIRIGGTNRIVANTTGLGFFNATPVAKPTALTAADATLATAITRIAELESKLQALGLLT